MNGNAWKLNENILRPPEITAKSWSIYDPITKVFLGGKNDNSRKEIASITKIMTFLTTIEIVDEQDISLNTIITVPKSAVRIRGTTSNLEEGDELRVIDLLYGIMIPSGNDSAMVLATFFGKFYHESLPIIGFVKVMNYLSEFLNLNDTFFQNPHGLSNRPNYSSAHDVNILAAYALKNKYFREIANIEEYACEINNPISGNRIATWTTTNKLLGQGFDGVKTGTTDKAGPCVCARVKDPICPLLITVLNSATSEDRWKDVIHLSTWAKRYSMNHYS